MLSVAVAGLKRVIRKSFPQNLEEFLKDLLKNSMPLTLKKFTDTEGCFAGFLTGFYSTGLSKVVRQ